MSRQRLLGLGLRQGPAGDVIQSVASMLLLFKCSFGVRGQKSKSGMLCLALEKKRMYCSGRLLAWGEAGPVRARGAP